MLKLRSRGNGTKRSLAMLLGVGALVLATQPVVRTAPPAAPPVTAPGLPFSKGFLVTGGYAVGSVDLAQHSGGNGFLTGTINMSGIPANADILAAYLYWQTIATNVSQVALPTFRGQQIESAREIAKVLDPSIAPCYSGGSSNNVCTMYAFLNWVWGWSVDELPSGPQGERPPSQIDFQQMIDLQLVQSFR